MVTVVMTLYKSLLCSNCWSPVSSSTMKGGSLTGHCQKWWTLPMLCTERGRERTGDLRDGQRASGGSGNGLERR